MKVYVQTSEDYNEVINISLIDLRTNCVGATLENPVIDLSKLSHYTLKLDEENGGEYILVLDEENYESIVKAKERAKAFEAGKEKEKEIRADIILKVATDADAYIMRYLYDPWEADTEYVIGDRRLYKDDLYKCKQDHTSQAQYTPDLIPAIWDILGAEEQGTIDNPVIVPETVSSMIYVKGKYYLEGATLYLMNREGMSDGEEISLTYKPSQLVGQYFEVVGVKGTL